MRRRALSVADAVVPEGTATDVLGRFGFAEVAFATSISDALARLRNEHFDLLIVPLQDVSPLQLSAIDREIRRLQTTYVIGTAPRPDSDLILRAMRSGIHEFLPLPFDQKDLASAVDRLMRRNQSDALRGRVFAVYSGKGGLGNTTIAVNLAHSLAANRRDARVAVADLVVAGGDVRVLLNLRPAYDLSDVVAKLDRIDSDLLHSLLTQRGGGLWALPGPDDPGLDNVLDGSATATIIELLRNDFALTVLDCEHHMSERTVAALDVADRILLVTELTVTALRSTQRSLAFCRRLGYPDEKLCVVVNRHQSGEVLSPKDAADVLKSEIFWKIPNDYRTAAAALAKGVPVAEHDAGSKLASSFTQLAAKLGGSAPATASSNGAGHDSPPRLKRLFGFSRKRG